METVKKEYITIIFGIMKGSCFHFNFFLTSATSSSPKAAPCEDSFPALLGDPQPMTVLQQRMLGWFIFSIAFSRAIL